MAFPFHSTQCYTPFDLVLHSGTASSSSNVSGGAQLLKYPRVFVHTTLIESITEAPYLLRCLRFLNLLSAGTSCMSGTGFPWADSYARSAGRFPLIGGLTAAFIKIKQVEKIQTYHHHTNLKSIAFIGAFSCCSWYCFDAISVISDEYKNSLSLH